MSSRLLRVKQLVLVSALLTMLAVGLADPVRSGASSGPPATADPILPTDPSLEGRELFDTPRTVEVATDAEVTLYDAWERKIPFTGALRIGRTLYLPGLIPGRYHLRSSDGARTDFQIKFDSNTGQDSYAMPAVEQPTGRTVALPALLVAGSGLVLAAALLLRKRRGLGLVLAGVSIVGAVALTSGTQSTEAPSLPACLALTNGDTHVAEYAQCALNRMSWTLRTAGLRAAVDEIDAAAIPPCHEVVHGFAQLAWFEVARSEILQPNLDTCNGAFYHGALYSASMYLDDNDFLDLLDGLCRTAVPDRDARGSCNHGVGHALAVRFGTETGRVEAACRQVAADSEHDLSECIAAGYMQHAKRWAKAKGEQAFLPDPAVPPSYFCDKTAPSELLSMCYLAVTMAETAKREMGMPELLARCNSLSAERSFHCVAGTSRDMISYYPQGGPEGALACVQSLGRAADIDECIKNFSYTVYDLNRDEGMLAPLCKAAGRPQELCFGHPELLRRNQAPEG